MDTKPGRREILLVYTACSWFSKAFGDAGVISDAISHGDVNRILYLYEKRPLNIVEFCNFCWKTEKNPPFHIMSPVKKFHGRAKGGIEPCPPPLKYATVHHHYAAAAAAAADDDDDV